MPQSQALSLIVPLPWLLCSRASAAERAETSTPTGQRIKTPAFQALSSFHRHPAAVVRFGVLLGPSEAKYDFLAPLHILRSLVRMLSFGECVQGGWRKGPASPHSMRHVVSALS